MTRLPALGRRGEGWLLAQIVLLWLVVGTCMLGPGWAGGLRAATTAVGLAVLGIGVLLVVRGAIDLRTALTPLPYPREGAPLVDTGVYALVRHPVYGGVVLCAFGAGLLAASPATLLVALALVPFFALKSEREEAWLMERHPGYAAYRRRTGRFIPFVW